MGRPGPASGLSVPICLFPQLSPLQRAREHAGTSPGPARLPIAHPSPQLKTLRKHMITSKLFKRSKWYEHETVTRPRERGSLTVCKMCVPQADSDSNKQQRVINIPSISRTKEQRIRPRCLTQNNLNRPYRSGTLTSWLGFSVAHFCFCQWRYAFLFITHSLHSRKHLKALSSLLVRAGIMGHMQLNQSCFSFCWPRKLQCVGTLGQKGSSSFGRLGSNLAVSNQGLMHHD